ncbi:MAG: putative damage endonuclease [Paenibacillaceae bacterium]|jgi:UV DNA damage endonuclease|nr:putative damage endonuclease [Paenibacillaceae bacterium]
MKVRLGYVAMSTVVQNASPSKTMTATSFAKLADRDAAIRKLERIAADNLHNTVRLLRHNIAHDIRLYRFSSKLIPLFGHPLLEDWDPIAELVPNFAEIGEIVRAHGMRVGFHPDHFTVLSTPREDVLRTSVADLERHVRMLDAMGLGEAAKCNIHIGGTYGDKEAAGQRFVRQFLAMSDAVRRRITLENDDKTFNASETLAICEQVGVPMVLDIHHDQVNPSGETVEELWPRILRTWTDFSVVDGADGMDGAGGLPPKIHASSPKEGNNVRSHADYIEPEGFVEFLRSVAGMTPSLDVMIEAKMKDGALFQLMDDLRQRSDVTRVDQATFTYEAREATP